MKKLNKQFAATYLILTIPLCLIGCGSIKTAQNPNNQLPDLKIGVSVYYQDDVFIKSIVDGLKETAKIKENLGKCTINLNLVDGQNSQTMQNDQVDKFIARGYDIICMNLVDRTAASTIIDKAKAADVPVIFFNREPVSADMTRWDKAFYVGSMAEEAGTMQGDIVLEEYEKNPDSIDRNQDGKIQYVILEGEQGHQDSLIRTEYCLKPLMDKDIPLEKLANGTANWQKSQGEEKMTGWLEEFKDRIEVVFSNNDEMALGAVSAIKKAGYLGQIKVVGVDGTEAAINAVRDGEMIGTVINDAKSQSESIMEIAYRLGMDLDMSTISEMEDNLVKIGHTPITHKKLIDK